MSFLNGGRLSEKKIPQGHTRNEEAPNSVTVAPPQIEIRRATREDWGAISRFIAACYGATSPFKQVQRWRWQFMESPYPEFGPEPPVWLAVCEGEVVGQIAVQPGSMVIEGQPRPAGWIVDVMVRPEFRGMGLGHRIHDVIAETGFTLVTLTMALATRRIAERAGAVTLGPVLQMVRTKSLSVDTLTTVLRRTVENRSGLARRAGELFLSSGVGPKLLTAVINLLAMISRPRHARSETVTVSQVDGPDPAVIDDIFSKLRVNRLASFDRSYSFIEWRFCKVPDLRYTWLEARREDRVLGYAIVRASEAIELSVGTLVDLIADPLDDEVRDALVGAAVHWLEPAHECVISGASHPSDISLMKRHGFHRVRTHRPTVVSKFKSILDLVRLNANSWSFSKADHDWDQIHPSHD